ncbi:MAG: outer membrane protein transport protein [Bacteroidia bacterium]|nr:outer membrane protein transport protein [Bacteroidia bacterium]
MKKILAIFIASLPCAMVAQNEIDALRYSQLNYMGGTARFAGMGSSFGGLGGDFSAVVVNPAGLGIYRKPELTFTPSFFSNTTTSTYNSTESSDFKSNFNFSNFGIVFAHAESGDEQEWKGVGFAFGYTRLNNFHSRMTMSGVSDSSSLLDVYLNSAQGFSDANTLDPFGAQLAWNTWLLDTLNAGNYYSVIPTYGQKQTKQITTRGHQGEMTFALAGNYANKLYIGASLNLPFVSYTEHSEFTESVTNDTTFNLKSYTVSQYLHSEGQGFNFKLGLIFKPTDFLRIGGSFHTPSLIELSDDYTTEITSQFTTGSFNSESPQGAFDYHLVTPARMVASVGIVIKKFAALNVDYEYADYSTARLSAPGYEFTAANNAISNKYKEAGQLRVGAEFKLAPLSLRAGYIMSESPYREGVNDGVRTSYSFGFGIREKNTFLDFAYVLSEMSEDYYFYDPKLVKPVTNTSRSSNYLLTIGFKF